MENTERRHLIKTYLQEDGKPFLAEDFATYEVDKKSRFTNPEEVYRLACQLNCDKLAEEEMYVLCTNTKGACIGLFQASKGCIDGTLFPIREIFQKTLMLGAVSIILWHNHPSGDVSPSNADITNTKRAIEAGELLGIKVLDHIIVGRGFASLKEIGEI